MIGYIFEIQKQNLLIFNSVNLTNLSQVGVYFHPVGYEGSTVLLYLYVVYVSSTSISNQLVITIFVILTKHLLVNRGPISSLYNKWMLLCLPF